VSRFSRKCGSLEVPQPYGPPWPVTGIALPFYLSRIFVRNEEIVHISKEDKVPLLATADPYFFLVIFQIISIYLSESCSLFDLTFKSNLASVISLNPNLPSSVSYLEFFTPSVDTQLQSSFHLFLFS
jgi:hypothetical protein